jgi:hypothetical protein
VFLFLYVKYINFSDANFVSEEKTLDGPIQGEKTSFAFVLRLVFCCETCPNPKLWFFPL